jgi:formylglycine-generating enzyme required for sulfatase activity
MKQNFSNFNINDIPCPLIFLQGGRFDMGERPAHPVHISYDFYMGKYPVTQALYQEVMEENPSYFKDPSRPVESVSWQDAKTFIERLQEREEVKTFLKAQNLSQAQFRLPSEAEWEYAARGGVHSQGYEYCGSDDLRQVGWYRDNSGGETKPVGLLLPNELGLFDMSGNVYEWCEDDWHSSYDSPDRPDDGSAWVDTSRRGTSRVFRGGSYLHDPVGCRPAFRFRTRPDGHFYFVGFRLVLSLPLEAEV